MLNSRQAVMLQIAMQILTTRDPQVAMDFSEELTDMVMGAEPVTSGETSVRPTPVAQKITESELKALITKAEYTHLAGTTKTFCHIFVGDFSVTGESACLNPADFDEVLGRQYAYKDAFDQLWKLEGYHRARVASQQTVVVSKIPKLDAAIADFANDYRMSVDKSAFAAMKAEVQ
jgi:hypothetical protein